MICCLSFVYFRVIQFIFSEVDTHIEKGDLLSEYKMSALPDLYDHFVKLIKHLVYTFFELVLVTV